MQKRFEPQDVIKARETADSLRRQQIANYTMRVQQYIESGSGYGLKPVKEGPLTVGYADDNGMVRIEVVNTATSKGHLRKLW